MDADLAALFAKAEEVKAPVDHSEEEEEETVLSSAPTHSKEFLAAVETISHKRKRQERSVHPSDYLDDEEQERAQKAAAVEKKGDGKGKFGPQGPPKQKKFLRTSAGKVWEDQTLADWPEGDHRLWIGQLGPEATDAMLTEVFSKYPSFNKARVINKKVNKCAVYGFVSFSDPMEMVRAKRENNGKYCGNRRMRIETCKSEKRDLKGVSQQQKLKNDLLKRLKEL